MLLMLCKVSCFQKVYALNSKRIPVSNVNQKIINKNSDLNMSTSSSSSSTLKFDTSAVAKYAASTGIEMIGIAGALGILDQIANNFISLPTPLIVFVFYALSLKSRIFSPLDNRRPDLKKAAAGGTSRGFGDRIMPSWTPPGVFFPIMWLLIISPLRAYSSLLIYQANGGQFLDITILALMLHLSIGDTWNTINNIEKRLGASVLGVLFVLTSAVFASYQYYQIDPYAGKLLGGTCIWLSIASLLIIDTWRLNPNEATGNRFPLYPVKGDAETRFFFESESN